MSETVIVSRTENTGVITLNRPEAINALTREMIGAIHAAFEDFSADADIAAILLEGTGPRGFCAGGDVRAVRQLVCDGNFAEAEAFFTEEYKLNGAIATSNKPVVALCDGVVMGGGIGLAGHAEFRFATDRARFAMPESAIGFMCDVGVDAILAKTTRHRALAFLMSGSVVGAADALALGLTDCIVPHEKLPVIREELFAAIAQGDVATSIVNVMQANGVDGGKAEFCQMVEGLAKAFSGAGALEIMHELNRAGTRNNDAKQMAELLATRSPTSLVAIFESHTAARKTGDISHILDADLALARWIIRQPDFVEGVRAVLVDKDQSPSWVPKDLQGFDIAQVKSCLR